MLRIATKKRKHVIEYMGAKFTVEPNTKEESQGIIKQNSYTEKVETPMGKSDKYEEKVDWIGVHADNIDSQVVAWDGIEGGDGKPLPCNSENKRALAMCKENEHICIYVQEEISKIGQAQEEKKKKKVKN